jgi:hypothetical protein
MIDRHFSGLSFPSLRLREREKAAAAKAVMRNYLYYLEKSRVRIEGVYDDERDMRDKNSDLQLSLDN